MKQVVPTGRASDFRRNYFGHAPQLTTLGFYISTKGNLAPSHHFKLIIFYTYINRYSKNKPLLIDLYKQNAKIAQTKTRWQCNLNNLTSLFLEQHDFPAGKYLNFLYFNLLLKEIFYFQFTILSTQILIFFYKLNHCKSRSTSTIPKQEIKEYSNQLLRFSIS